MSGKTTQIFPCEGSSKCQIDAQRFRAEMEAQGQVCVADSGDSYALYSARGLAAPMEISVTCTPLYMIAENAAPKDEITLLIERIEENNRSSRTVCSAMDPTADFPSDEEFKRCTDESSWEASIELAQLVTERKTTGPEQTRIVNAVAEGIRITLEMEEQFSGETLNTRSVNLWSAFSILSRLGTEEDGITVRTLMAAIRARRAEYAAIVELARVAPESEEFAEAKALLQPMITKYVALTADPGQRGKVAEFRLAYYDAIRVIAPDSEAERRARHNICDDLDEYRSIRGMENYIEELSPVCSATITLISRR